MSKPSLHSLTRKHPSTRDVSRAYVASAKVDDRSCVVIMTSILERQLEKFLRAKMIRLSADAESRLFHGNGPLAALSAKIRIVRAFGLIGPRTAHNFEILNDIRNVFAHSARILTFRNRKIQNRLTGIHFWDQAGMLADALPHFDDTSSWEKKLYSTKRGHFVLVIIGYIYALEMTGSKSRRIKKTASDWLSQ